MPSPLRSLTALAVCAAAAFALAATASAGLSLLHSTRERKMISAQRIVAVIAAAGVAAAIALTPTSDSDAFDAKAGPSHADISARHGHAIR